MTTRPFVSLAVCVGIALACVPPATAQSDEKKPPKPHAYKHPSLRIGDDVTLEFSARIESDVRMATPSIGFDEASVEWADRRIGVEGTAFKRLTFELSRELSDDFGEPPVGGGETAWKDAYVKARVSRALIVGAGRFKQPFGREALTGETNLDFVYRSLASRVLTPGRDVGVMSEGRLLGRAIEYQAGYFTRDGENARTSETLGGEDAIVGRVVVSPFASAPSEHWLAPLEVGVAVSNSSVDNRLGLRGRTVLGDGIFFDRVYVNGRRQRTGLEAAWARGPASLSAEYITAADERHAMGFAGEDLPSVHAASWYIAGTWALTGERKRGRLEPHHDLFRGGFGAIELAVRFENLKFDTIEYPGSQFGFPTESKLVGNADRVTTLGVNWYLNDYLKIQINLITEGISDPARSPSSAEDGRFTSAVIRFQFRL